MHELSVFRDLMGKIQALAREQRARRVVAIDVRLGALCHLSPEHFREHFAQLSCGTPAEGANLRLVVGHDPTEPHAQDMILTSLEFEVDE